MRVVVESKGERSVHACNRSHFGGINSSGPPVFTTFAVGMKSVIVMFQKFRVIENNLASYFFFTKFIQFLETFYLNYFSA